ncbi:MAG TPA: hypothetical protein PLH98_20640, partial [Ruminococcus flavefaciens]|nr:hypothetical protein [Ruminococcus flavefaciens]
MILEQPFSVIRVIFRVTTPAFSCDFTQFQRHTRISDCICLDSRKACISALPSKYRLLILADREEIRTLDTLLTHTRVPAVTTAFRLFTAVFVYFSFIECSFQR